MVDPKMDGKTRNLLRMGPSIDSPLHSQCTWKAKESADDWTLIPSRPSAEFQA